MTEPGPESRLFVRPRVSAERMLLVRLSVLIGLVMVILAIFWFDRDGLRDNIDGHVSFTDIVYFTAVTVTTVGYGDIVPVSDRARIADSLFVTPLRLVIWLVFLGTAYELILQRWLEKLRMTRIQMALRDHLIICGYGHSGQSAAREAIARGTPAGQIVVMDRVEERVRRAMEHKSIGLQGDATTEEDLAAARVEHAQAVLVCVGRDDTAVLTVLTVRQLNPKVRIVCNVSEQENVKLLRQAGADALITPSVVGGYLMADSLRTSHVADYIADLMCTGGAVSLKERPVAPEEIGLSLREVRNGLAVRLIRDGEVITGDSVARSGDRLLVIDQHRN